jgi:hypothetical protein
MHWEKREWPAGETVPKSPQEARQLRWDTGAAVFIDPFSGAGTARFSKYVGELKLFVSLPITSKLTFGEPVPDAELCMPDDPTKRQLFDVEFLGPKTKVVRVLAEDEEDAYDLASDFFETSLSARKPDKKRRKIHQSRAFSKNQEGAK